MIEPMIQRHTGDIDAVIAHVGEIGKSQPSWRMLLPEDDVLLGPVQRPPGTDAPLQGTPNSTNADATALMRRTPTRLVRVRPGLTYRQRPSFSTARVGLK